jgi:glutamate N-acetyltransferase/amino-acid N-acetyltransferase
MAVGLTEFSELLPVPGVRLGTAQAGVRYKGRNDVVLMEFCPGSSCAGVFTRNAFCAAPVVIAKRHMHSMAPRMFLINSGNANAGTGRQGEADALACCASLAEVAACSPEEVLPFSTGVIGEPLPVERISAVLPALFDGLSATSWAQAARAIMTTDTLAKGVSRQVGIEGTTVTITGIAKGSGMIRPDMATMLAYIATDAGMGQEELQQCLQAAMNESFNRITVDGDTSTNDACMLVATGKSGLRIKPGSRGYTEFYTALREVCVYLAQAVVRDGEGATKFITIDVEEGMEEQECLDVAYTIAHSPLVKTAFYASDPNWGRILAAIGRAGLSDLDLDKVRVYLNDVCIVEQGARAVSYTEQAGQAVMHEAEITIRVLLGRGTARSRVWTTDLSHEYVRINAEYRS